MSSCEPSKGEPPPSPGVPLAINWDLCALCQTKTSQQLQCPGNNTRQKEGSSYTTVAENLKKFEALGCPIPISVDLQRLDEGNGIEATLIKNNAKFHPSCRYQINSTQLKRKAASFHMKQSDQVDQDQIESDHLHTPSKLPKRMSTVQTDICIFCDKKASLSELRQASTFDLDAKLRQKAEILQDSCLLAKLSGGDVISLEVKYHPDCLVKYYRAAAQKENLSHADSVSSKEKKCHGLAFAQLVEYIMEVHQNEIDCEKMTVFKLADLTTVYQGCLQEMGLATNKVHSTRLKDRILACFPDMHCYQQGRDVLLGFSKQLGGAMKTAYEENFDDEGMHLAKTAQIIRRDLFQMSANFQGKFHQPCQYDSVPGSLMTLLTMILQGSNLKNNCAQNQAAVSIAQLINFNCTKSKRPREGNTSSRHMKARETPLPLFLGLTVHAQTRKRDLVDLLHSLGLSVGYSRVLEISAEVAQSVCKQFRDENVVCPFKLKQGLFTTAAIDNIDHNPTSTTSRDSFHGTSLSLFQHPTKANEGTERQCMWQTDGSKAIPQLPDFYLEIPPVMMKMPVEPSEQLQSATMEPVSDSLFREAVKVEHEWLSHVSSTCTVGSQDPVDNASWGAYHASMQLSQSTDLTPGISCLLPLFKDHSKSPAMIKHAMNVIQSAVHHVNQDQTPVITLDQPLFAIAKQIQWKWAETYGERKFVLILGGLHIEMSFLKALGHLLSNSGWTDVLVESKIASPGTADSFLNATHVTKTRYAHQVTVCALYSLIMKAYTEYSSSAIEGTALSFDSWCETKTEEIPMFLFWHLVLQLQVTLLVFMSALRGGDFELYVESLHQIVPWFFAFDQINYARWLSVHIFDMVCLKDVSPTVHSQFVKGHFVLQKSTHLFSKVALDQAHEQNNAIIKGDGGAVGLTENPSALRRWMVSGPEISRIIQEFEEALSMGRPTSEPAKNVAHHEQRKGFQENFQADVQNLMQTVEKYGNPFMETSKDLLILHSKDIVSPSVVNSLKTMHSTGLKQYTDFVTDRLTNKTKKISSPLKKNNMPTMVCPKQKSNNRVQKKLLMNNCELFSKLYIACQRRSGGLNDFFIHENHPFPPSLSNEGHLRQTQKSTLLQCLETYYTAYSSESPPEVSVIIIDGAAVVNMLQPGPAKTFADYANQVFIPFLHGQLHFASHRLDIIWDVYVPNSLKSQARKERGRGTRRRVTAETLIPANWASFLRCSANKKELFAFLADHIKNMETHKLVITTKGPTVLTSHDMDVDYLSTLHPCTHEEADTRMILHLAQAASDYTKIMIKTVDTDVVVLAVKAAVKHDLEELWVAFGTGVHFRFIPAHQIATALGPSKAKSLPVFHSLTGCDTVSSFNGIGKKKAWRVWEAYDDITECFLHLSAAPSQITDLDMALIQRFVILLYDRASNALEVNSARLQLFTKAGRQMENIPPTSAALLQHVKRAVYQAGHIWGQASVATPFLPDPCSWGWQMVKGQYQPFWTHLPQASEACQELIRCRCQKGCRANCSCVRQGLQCTALCTCNGDCRGNPTTRNERASS